MKLINADLNYSQKNIIELVKNYLDNGKIVMMPSDTVYGLSVKADNGCAIKNLRKFKGRPCQKPLLILVSSLSMAKRYLKISKDQEIYLKKIWQKEQRPCTVILDDKKVLSKELNFKNDSLAVRLPKNVFLTKLIKCLNVPLVSTSANLNGLNPTLDVDLLSESLKNKKPDLLIDSGKCKIKKSSRLIDLREYPKIKIIRK